MSSDPIQLWRMTPVAAGAGASTAGDVDRRHIFPSARQAIDAVVGHARLGRRAYVGMPDFAGHCVIDFLSRRATAVPLRFLPVEEASAVLVYDQWGWQRPPERLTEVLDRFGKSLLIWDRVDSLAPDVTAVARADARARTYQIFSLSKTLGAGGGGLAWSGRDGWLRPALEAGAFGAGLSRWAEGAPASPSDLARIDRFLRNDVPAWTPALDAWLATHSIAAASESEANERRARLALCVTRLDLELPAWMIQSTAAGRPAPGILPVRVTGDIGRLVQAILAETGVELCAYHFDFSDSYLAPQWTPVLPVPLHSQTPLDRLERLCAIVRDACAPAR